jgi:hypothetical protein
LAEASERLNVVAECAENEKPLGHTVWFFAPPRQRRRKNASPACARSLENREKKVRVRGGGRERVRRREAYLERARVAWAAGAEAARCMACFRRGGAGDGRRGRREVRCRSRRRLRDGRRRARRTRILWRTALFSGDVAFATASRSAIGARGFVGRGRAPTKRACFSTRGSVRTTLRVPGTRCARGDAEEWPPARRRHAKMPSIESTPFSNPET